MVMVYNAKFIKDLMLNIQVWYVAVDVIESFDLFGFLIYSFSYFLKNFLYIFLILLPFLVLLSKKSLSQNLFIKILNQT